MNTFFNSVLLAITPFSLSYFVPLKVMNSAIKRGLRVPFLWRTIIFSAILSLCALSSTYAVDMVLEWDGNAEPYVLGYRLYYKIGSYGKRVLSNYDGAGLSYVGEPYNGQAVNSGFEIIKNEIPDFDEDIVRCKISGISNKEIYYFVITAFSSEGGMILESEASNEVCYQTITADEDTPVNIALTGSDTLACVLLTHPSHGILSGTAPYLTYTPYPGYSGADNFTFVAYDKEVEACVGIVSITVNAVDAPAEDEPGISGSKGTGSSGCFISAAAFGSKNGLEWADPFRVRR